MVSFVTFTRDAAGSLAGASGCTVPAFADVPTAIAPGLTVTIASWPAATSVAITLPVAMG